MDELYRKLLAQLEEGQDTVLAFITEGGGSIPRTTGAYMLVGRETGRMFSDRIRQVYLELPYFQKEPDECENDFERWIYLLKHMDTLERMPFKAKKAVFDKLLEVADVANLSKEERIQYDEALKRYRDYKNTIDYAEEKGILKGKESTARNMKADGLSPSIIQKYTGLSLEDIEKL